MKKLLTLFSFILAMSSCSHKPDNTIQETKTEQTGWVVDKAVSDKPIQKFDTYYKISPTWGQAIHYAYKTPDQAFAVFVSFILFIAFCILFIGQTANARWMPKVFENTNILSAVLFILIVGSVYAWYNKPGNIKFNNDKWVKKEVYDNAMQETGSTQPIWDSLETNHLIIDGPY
jgi:hypothetical protein